MTRARGRRPLVAALSCALLPGALLLGAALLTACGEREEPRAAAGSAPAVNMTLARAGQQLFRSRSFGRIAVACADCHAETDDSLASTDRLRAGHSILGAARRISTWNGAFSGGAPEPAAAGTARCARRFMGRRNGNGTGLSADEAAALVEFFEAISAGDEARSLAWSAFAALPDTAQTSALLADEALRLARARGDAARGAARYALACAFCHAAERDAAGPAPGLRAIARRAGQLPSLLRLGGGAMPFFSTDKLSAGDIADLAAFLAGDPR